MRPTGAIPLFISRCRSGAVWCASKIGPGVITGASDDDPSGIATYAIAGATAGYSMLWLALITTPMMIVVQETCARIALVSGKGLVQAMGTVTPAWLVRMLILLVVGANTLNIAADIAGMSSSAELVTRVPASAWAIGLGALLIGVEVFASYRLFASIVKWLCLALLSYVVTAFVVHVDWRAAFFHTVVPEIRFERMWLATLVGFLGTTITPYLFVWQAGLEIEERIATTHKATAEKSQITRDIRASDADVTTGMVYSNVVSWFIVLTTAATLHVHGVTIATVRDTAEALRPLAGANAELLFALGVLGAGLLAVPVLAGSSAYGIAEALGWREGLGASPRSAPAFYGVIALGIVLGVLADLFRLDAVWALFWSAVVNGFVAVPLLIAIAITSNQRKLMGEWRSGRLSNFWMIATIVLMTIAAIGLVVTT